MRNQLACEARVLSVVQAIYAGVMTCDAAWYQLGLLLGLQKAAAVLPDWVYTTIIGRIVVEQIGVALC